MDTPTLVERKQREGQRLTRALLADAEFDLAASLWWFDTDESQWQLVLGTGLARREGPKAAYRQVRRALQKLGSKRAGPAIAISDVRIVSDRDRMLQALGSAVSVTDSTVRLTQNLLNGVYVDDAYVYHLEARPNRSPKLPPPVVMTATDREPEAANS